MKISELYIIRYLRIVYGGTISYKDGNFYIEVDGNQIVFSTTNKKNGKYTFSFKDGNRQTNKSMRLQDKSLAHGLFLIWPLEVYRKSGVYPTEEDWNRFSKDAYKYMTGSE